MASGDSGWQLIFSVCLGELWRLMRLMPSAEGLLRHVCVHMVFVCKNNGDEVLCLSFSPFSFTLLLQQVSQSHSQDWNICSPPARSAFFFSPICSSSLSPRISLVDGAALLSICCVPRGKLRLHFMQTYILQSLATYFTLTLGFISLNSCFGFGRAHCCCFLSHCFISNAETKWFNCAWRCELKL